MRIEGDLGVFMGAIILWISAVTCGLECILAGVENDWGSCAFKFVATLGLVSIGRRVWRAA